MAPKTGLDFEGDKREENIRFLYEKALEARNFHYDNFTKWQTFFYVAVGSVFVAYYVALFDADGCCTCNTSETQPQGFVRILLPIIGYIFSLIWLCSSKGYTYWWNAYMECLSRFEGKNILGWEYDNNDELKSKDGDEKNSSYAVFNAPKLKPCAGVFKPFSGANFSTSKLANAMAFVSACAWGSVSLFPMMNPVSSCSWVIIVLSPMLFTWAVSVPVVRIFFGSDIPKHMRKCGCNAECALYGGCVVVFAHLSVLILVSLFCFCVLKPSSLCSESVLACGEVWLLLSLGLSVCFRKAWCFLNREGVCRC